ncbi:MAG: ABC transporter ATP-binding protein [Candidatus Cohnella colombiensis]|uniref:ABC transporter ATP-binding protein n=1 Tax=Candidatus Cohnella colombiensis TaxID=3121368 RepID=A0AA95EVS6_9BACL|nr:MAG: ABC transporter ATP-binding protein [Cohnella sp.]
MEARNIKFAYDKKTDQLRGISCEIAIGKITTIIGPNGCGKSTLLGVLSANYIPREGLALLNGKVVHQYKPKELAKQLAVVHQQNEAPSDMTVERLVSFGRQAHRSLFSHNVAEDEKAIEWALTCTSLEQKRETTIDQLSGGERQRVWIAMALAQQTPILFLDEPTTYLDIYYQIEILELVRKLNTEHGLTIVMVLHDINQAIRYSDHIIVMSDGEVVIKGKPHEVVTASMMKQIYGVDVAVKNDLDIGLYIVPIGI